MKDIFRDLSKELYLEANFKLRPDIKKYLRQAYKSEKAGLAKSAIEAILKNARIAESRKIAICQDTGFPVFFLKIGNVNIKHLKDITDGLKEGLKKATYQGALRLSTVREPLERECLKPNNYPVFHIDFSRTKDIEVTLLVKGFGSENQTKLCMLNPESSEDEITEIVVGHVKNTGSKACPPYIIGIGIGGTADKAITLSKEATLLKLGGKNKNRKLALLEQKIKKEVNKLGIGPLGVGGKATCLGVKILTHPTHIAGLPLGITLSCHATRSAKRVIRVKGQGAKRLR